MVGQENLKKIRRLERKKDEESAPRSPAVVDHGEPTWRLVLALAWPVLAQQFLILTVGIVDRFLAGRVESDAGAEAVAYQAAQSTAQYLTWFVSSYAVLISAGSTALVARCIGAGDRRLARQVTHQSLLLAVIFGLLGSGVGLLGLESIVAFMQLRGAAAVFAVSYLQPLFGLLVFQLVEAAGIACLIGAGDTRTGMWVLAGVTLVNVPLSLALFYGCGPVPALGFVGIAWGTALSFTIGGLAVLAVLIRGRAGLRLRLRYCLPDGSLIYRLLRISVPAGMDSLSVALGHLWFVSIINQLGNAAAAAHGIALTWEALAFLSGYSFGMAAMTLVGQNLGANRPDRAAHSGWVAFAIGGGLMCVMGVLFFALARPMFGIFCPKPEQLPAIAAGVPALRLVAFAMPALASCIIFTQALRGAGDTRVPLLFTWIGFLGVRIPLAYLLTRPEVSLGPLGTLPGMDLGLFGAWLAMFADLHVRGAFFVWRFASGRWQRLQV
ncbi:MAG: MATE family efflux transporter [Gemmataceae bacterium]